VAEELSGGDADTLDDPVLVEEAEVVGD